MSRHHIIDERMIQALHVERLRKADIVGDEHLHHVLFQTSTIGALIDGKYEGDVTFAELGAHGDFGIGTFQALDGEMVALDGEFFQVRSDGTVHPVAGTTRTPFAVVTTFEADVDVEVERPTRYADICRLLDSLVDPNVACYAIRLDGFFGEVTARSVPRQQPPYPPLVAVVEHQPVFTYHQVAGSLVGFRFPDYAQGLNVPGYHLHFISDDRKRGGHLIDCAVERGKIQIDHTCELHIEMPRGTRLPEPDLSDSTARAIAAAEG
jgi:acetolactate decarboxylase